MRTLLLAVCFVCAMDSQAADVKIYLKGSDVVPGDVIWRAKAKVATMFSKVGIRLTWTAMKPAHDEPAIRINVFGSSSARAHYGALAFSTPFEESEPMVSVFYDRVEDAVRGRPEFVADLLAHVLAHEIGHILRADDSHQTTGIMKAHWSAADYDRMAVDPLSFTRLDAQMMREHLAKPRLALEAAK